MKVIFLDIDGVMNSELFYRARHKKRWFKARTYYWWILSKIKYILNGFKYKYVSLANYKVPESHKKFKYLFNRLKRGTDPLQWRWLSELCNENDYKICISSIWKRHFYDINDWDKSLTKLGFKEGTFVGITGHRRTERGTEIQEWIDKIGTVEAYAIIDDDSDMLESQLKSFFKTDAYCGLSPNICYQIKRHLK